ncbi:hypothetical protein [Dechloromonas sp. H13]|uniref:hypothetical protein n=1 Tax=Dechloromonas sp. H13 TaxID=2570193 RepID=UPI0012921E4E|nr:hypothetical protein [Dechloromonas sp. H13]
MIQIRSIILLLFIFSLIGSALAEVEICHARINGESVDISFDSNDDLYIENTTFREIFFSGWDGSCPGYIVLRHMTPKLSAKERETFCAEYDKKSKSYSGFSLGRRDAYGQCKKPGKICETVNATKDEALAIVGLGAGAAGGATLATSAAGITAVTHSSGAVILTGSAGYIAGTLGTVAASVVSVLTAPATLVGATVSVVAVGGAVYLCKPSS